MDEPQKVANQQTTTLVFRTLTGEHRSAPYTPDEQEFIDAMSAYKKKERFPAWSQVYALFLALGYRKVPKGHHVVPIAEP